MALKEHGQGEEVVNIVSQFIGGTTLEIQVDYYVWRMVELSRFFI